MTKPELIEARCPNAKCGKTHKVFRWADGTTQEAFCPPNSHHKGWRGMKPSPAGTTALATQGIRG